jgi:peptide/nickel transport system substrate-binding protein
VKLRDRALIGALTVALIAFSIAALAPSLHSSDDSAEPTLPPGLVGRTYVEGVLGRASNASPFGARSAADRALVSLLFRGLVKLGPDNSIVGDLAARWEVDASGRTWTFYLRPDLHWEDGEPLTADDVAFTIDVLSNPGYTGPGAESWRDVRARVIDEMTVDLRLTTPLGGFLQAATQPIAPAHILAVVPPDELADDPFGTQPIASGPFRLVFFEPQRAVLAALTPVEVAAGIPGRPNFETPRPTDSLATAQPTPRADLAVPYLSNVELRYYDDVESLRSDWAAGVLDALSGLPPDDATELGKSPGATLLRYPGTTLLAATLDLRTRRGEFQDPMVRLALLEAIDRDAIVSGVLDGFGARADSLIPPSSEMFDPAVSTPVQFDPVDARKRLIDAGWKVANGSWIPKGFSEAVEIEILCPEETANPVAYAVATEVVAAWHALGLAVRLVPLPAAELLGNRLARGDFQVAVVPLAIGLDPDLYPLLAASQTRTGGSNVAGLQDPDLDELLVAARTPVDVDDRVAAYGELQKRLASRLYMLPLAFRDDYVVFRDTVIGPVSRPVGSSGDRYWDVLTWRLANGS